MGKLYYPPTQNGLQKELNAQLDSGVTASMTLNNTTGVQNKPGVAVLNRIDGDGIIQDASDREYISFTGVSGNTLTGLARNVDNGSSDQDHAIGTVVEFIFDVVMGDDLVDAVALVVDEDDNTAVNETNVVTPAGTQTLTNKTLTSPTLTTPTIDTIASTRVNPRETTETSSATPTINTDNTDIHTITALATDITSFTTNLSGTPVDGQKLVIRIQDSGSGQTIAWGASFENAGGTLPTTITAGKKAYVGLFYNADDSIWDCVAAVEEA